MKQLLLVPLAIIALYLAARLVFWAWFRTRCDFETQTTKEDESNGKKESN